jgi:hypothetical protein
LVIVCPRSWFAEGCAEAGEVAQFHQRLEMRLTGLAAALYAEPTRRTSMIADRIGRVCLIILEVIVLAIYLALRTLRVSDNVAYSAWIGYMFGWLVILLLVTSLKMFSKERLLAILGLGLVALIVIPLLFPTYLSGRR